LVESADVAYQEANTPRFCANNVNFSAITNFILQLLFTTNSSHIRLIAQYIQDGKYPAGTEKQVVGAKAEAQAHRRSQEWKEED
jgi:hypothetical protein